MKGRPTMSLGGATAILIIVNGPKHLSRKHRKQALPPYHDNLETEKIAVQRP